MSHNTSQHTGAWLGMKGATARFAGFVWAVVACAVTTVLAVAAREWLAGANLILLYLLAVVLVSARYGRGPGILASVLAVVVFDIFLIPPYLSIVVADPQYLLTLAIMLTVSIVISHLTASLHQEARSAQQSERRAIELFELSKELSGALTAAQIEEIGVRRLDGVFDARTRILVPGTSDALVNLGDPAMTTGLPDAVLLVAALVLERGGAGDTAGSTVSTGIHYTPLLAPMRTRGVLLLQQNNPQVVLSHEQTRLLQICAAQIALAIERVHYVEIAQRAMLAIESEQLRNSLLSAISHDIRTPLTAIVGLSDNLLRVPGLSEATKHVLAEEIHASAMGVSRLVSNLLDMARLQGDVVRLNRQWQLLEEVTGAALDEAAYLLADMQVEVCLSPSLPPLELDAVLIERVLFNLLDNARKHAGAGTFVRLVAVADSQFVAVSVIDKGPGLAPGTEQAIFEKFVRGAAPGRGAGVGLGLAICKTIVEAHGGRIWAENTASGGACFTFLLKQGVPPLEEAL